MADLNTNVQYIHGVGEKRAKALGKLDIHTLQDLVRYYPRRYEDRRKEKTVAECVVGETACIRAMVISAPRLSRVRRGLDIVKLRASDDSGTVDITYFNQSYIRDQLREGETYIFFGKVDGSLLRKTMTNPVWEHEDSPDRITGRIWPVYRTTKSISARMMAKMVEFGLEECGDILPELLPDSIRREYSLAAAGYAYRNIHFPKDDDALCSARKRLVFEELFCLSTAMEFLKRGRTKKTGDRFAAVDMEAFYRTLPFEPTGAQQRAVQDALSDMYSGNCMNRLIQGDVGSGKTLVSAACIYAAWKNGYQSALMAPTEILAEQHLQTMQSFLSPFGIRVGMFLGSQGVKQRRELQKALLAGEMDLAVGTHALLSDAVSFSRLGLVVTDEQHRFGVDQRVALSGKGERPHVMVMSATPIPRTLALIIYGDLDISVIDELPPGRQPVQTFAVDESYRMRLNSFIAKQIGEGRQVFIVCPKVEEEEESDSELLSAVDYAQKLQKEFPRWRIGCVHGKMRPKEKESIMTSFVSGETDILVSTTVVEVGVDVPNASLMIIENAERFGLSQLHQLRGRVGRGKHQSYCILVSKEASAAGESDAKERLSTLCRTSDGFKVAETDLRLRGPGDFFGSRQHGLPDTHIADLGADMDVLKQAQEAARTMLQNDPGLQKEEHSALLRYIQNVFELKQDIFN